MAHKRSTTVVKLLGAALASGAIYFSGASVAQAHDWERPRVREAYRYAPRDARGWWHYHYYDRHYGPPPWAARWYKNKHWRDEYRRDYWRDRWRYHWWRRDRD
ncbi:MAG TPA: hypothetical protein VNL14_01395 [Candidatus Acidoferrales bacterium]|nr:hypothetical protein [Candidatus Acidoferrales bacterium]